MEFNLQSVQGIMQMPEYQRTIIQAAKRGHGCVSVTFTDKLQAEAAHKLLVNADFTCTRMRKYNERDGVIWCFLVEWWTL